ncbi:alpha/beta fold hydrolase [Nocardia asteroides]|uniref:alpha/beta fold hydrolase n=1 Tax=Nocardia asteroides TaxID=1824 RepID=UPI0037BD8AC6
MPQFGETRSVRSEPDSRYARDDRPTFVLVHGAHGSASSWSALLRELALLGHRGLAVDLPGHGLDAHFPLAYQAPQDLDALTTEPSPLTSFTLEDNASHVIETIRRVGEFGPVVLVGTSGGGATISVVGNRVPELLAGMDSSHLGVCLHAAQIAAILVDGFGVGER